jgi:hypothetical protein
MVLTLYTNKSSDDVVTKDITQLVSLTGTLREGCSIIDPVIRISDSQFNNSHAASCNYAKVDEFGRYYFVNDIVSNGKFWEIHMHCDVLSSFQTDLKKLDAIIARNENKYNLYLQDGLMKTYANPHYQIIQFPSGFETQQFVFAVVG